jgi:hypothetical protein
VLASSVTQCAGDESLACADSTQFSLQDQVVVLFLELVLTFRGVDFSKQVFDGIEAFYNAHVNYFYDRLGACDAQPSDPACTILA